MNVDGNTTTAGGGSKLGAVPPHASLGGTALDDRRPPVTGGRRAHRVYVTLDEVEVAALHDRAGAQGWSIPHLMVECALKAPPTSSGADRRAHIAALLELRRLLANATANLNQLARAANITGQLPAAAVLASVLSEVGAAADAIRQAVEERG